MSIGVVADFEIVHIYQRDACGADDTGCEILIVAAVVRASQDIVVKFCTVALCCFLKLFLGFGLHLFHVGAIELPLQVTDQQNVRSDTKADHDELLKVQRGVKKKAVVGRKEKRRVQECNEAAYDSCCIAAFHEHSRKNNKKHDIWIWNMKIPDDQAGAQLGKCR